MHFAFLGTSGAVPSLGRDNTSIVFVGPGGAVLLDCGGSPIQKLMLAAVDPMDVPRKVGCDEVFTNSFLTKIEPPKSMR